MMAPDFLKLTLEEREKFIPKWRKQAEKYEMKILFWGTAIGVSEHIVVVLESAEHDNYFKFLREWQGLGTPNAGKHIEYTRTITVH
jgi:hypothetical protein